jgi:hypothetical protein
VICLLCVQDRRIPEGPHALGRAVICSWRFFLVGCIVGFLYRMMRGSDVFVAVPFDIEVLYTCTSMTLCGDVHSAVLLCARIFGCWDRPFVVIASTLLPLQHDISSPDAGTCSAQSHLMSLPSCSTLVKSEP